MNSSGIKRGLAATAISALAVTGLPALAGSASAAPGDVIQVQSAGTTRNGGDQGALIVLNTKGVDPALLDLAGTGPNYTADGEDNATQDVNILGTPTLIASGTTGDNTPNDGYDQISLRVQVTTPPGGDDVADFAIFEDEDADGEVDLTEARTQTSVETTGEVATLEVTPESQSSPSGQPSGAYTVTIRDSEGDLTQLTDTETVALTDNGDLTFGGDGDGDAIDASEINDGTGTFTATGTALGSQTITATTNGKSDNAVLNVTKAATLTLADIDVVTGADSSDGAPAEDPTYVRVDQSSVTLAIDSADTNDANSTVTFTVTSEGGNGVTFGGKPSMTVTTTLDANGVGSVTITPDAGTVQEGDGFSVSGSGITDLDVIFQRAAVTASSLDAPSIVYTQVDTPTSVTVTVTDQFGNPVQGAQVSASSAGNGAPKDLPRQTTDASGQTTFTFPAGDTQVGDQDVITYTVYDDAADASGTEATEKTTVKYTADGQGPDYQIVLDGLPTEAPTYSPDDVTVVPLTDAVADDEYRGFAGVTEDETAELTITNGEAGSPVTVTVDGGALILTGGKTSLEDGKASVTGVVGNTFQIVGTTSGIVTVTTTSGGRTETAQLTVEAQDDTSTARNVSVSGPAEVPHGTTQIQYVAVITDAFGNPVEGFSVGQLNIQVTGPAEFQDSGAVTDENGQINLNVRVDSGAEGVVTIRVQGLPNGTQFGADEDRVSSTSNSDDGKGLSESSDVATASTTVESAPVVEPPVPAGLVVRGRNNGAQDDKIVARAINLTAGATVRLFRKTSNGLKLLRTETMNSKGNHKFDNINDKNGRKYTKYVVKVAKTDETKSGRGARKVR